MIHYASQVARSIPFDPTGTVLTSTNVQNAIEEFLTKTGEIDRYSIQCEYNGNANAGRYLEIYTNRSSDTTPFVAPAQTKILAISLGSSNTATWTLGLFKTTDFVTPFVTFSVNNNNRALFIQTVTGINTGDEIAYRVTSVNGSLSKPFVRTWYNSVLT